MLKFGLSVYMSGAVGPGRRPEARPLSIHRDPFNSIEVGDTANHPKLVRSTEECLIARTKYFSERATPTPAIFPFTVNRDTSKSRDAFCTADIADVFPIYGSFLRRPVEFANATQRKPAHQSGEKRDQVASENVPHDSGLYAHDELVKKRQHGCLSCAPRSLRFRLCDSLRMF
jgi:hypothetical protein